MPACAPEQHSSAISTSYLLHPNNAQWQGGLRSCAIQQFTPLCMTGAGQCPNCTRRNNPSTLGKGGPELNLVQERYRRVSVAGIPNTPMLNLLHNCSTSENAQPTTHKSQRQICNSTCHSHGLVSIAWLLHVACSNRPVHNKPFPDAKSRVNKARFAAQQLALSASTGTTHTTTRRKHAVWKAVASVFCHMPTAGRQVDQNPL